MKHETMRRNLLNAFDKWWKRGEESGESKAFDNYFYAAQIIYIHRVSSELIHLIYSIALAFKASIRNSILLISSIHHIDVEWTREKENRQFVIWHQTWRWSSAYCVLRLGSEWRSERQTAQLNWGTQDKTREKNHFFFERKRHKYVFLSLVSLDGQKTKNIFFLLLYIHKLPSGNQTTKHKIKSTKNKIYNSSFVFKFYWRNIERKKERKKN